MQSIETLVPVLSALRDDNGSANIVIDVAPGSILVEGNRAGLIEFARQILMVASKEMSGAHQDLDKAGFASKAAATLTVALNLRLT